MRIQQINGNIYQTNKSNNPSMTGLKLSMLDKPVLYRTFKSMPAEYKPPKFFSNFFNDKLGKPAIPLKLNSARDIVASMKGNVRITSSEGIIKITENIFVKSKQKIKQANGTIKKIKTYVLKTAKETIYNPDRSIQVLEFDKKGTKRRETLYKFGTKAAKNANGEYDFSKCDNITVNNFTKDPRTKQTTIIINGRTAFIERFKHKFNFNNLANRKAGSEKLMQIESLFTGKKYTAHEFSTPLRSGEEKFERFIYKGNKLENIDTGKRLSTVSKTMLD